MRRDDVGQGERRTGVGRDGFEGLERGEVVVGDRRLGHESAEERAVEDRHLEFGADRRSRAEHLVRERRPGCPGPRRTDQVVAVAALAELLRDRGRTDQPEVRLIRIAPRDVVGQVALVERGRERQVGVRIVRGALVGHDEAAVAKGAQERLVVVPVVRGKCVGARVPVEDHVVDVRVRGVVVREHRHGARDGRLVRDRRRRAAVAAVDQPRAGAIQAERQLRSRPERPDDRQGDDRGAEEPQEPGCPPEPTAAPRQHDDHDDGQAERDDVEDADHHLRPHGVPPGQRGHHVDERPVPEDRDEGERGQEGRGAEATGEEPEDQDQDDRGRRHSDRRTCDDGRLELGSVLGPHPGHGGQPDQDRTHDGRRDDRGALPAATGRRHRTGPGTDWDVHGLLHALGAVRCGPAIEADDTNRVPARARATLPSMPPPSSTSEPSAFVRSRDGTRIAVFRSGDGPPLVLVHGATADHTAFRVVGPMFGTSFAVYAIDRRGRGASGDAEGPYSIEREFEDVAAVAETLAADAGGPVDVFGHSYGGRCALGAALLTDSIRRVISYEGAPTPPGSSYHPPGIEDRLRERLAAGDNDGALATFLTRGRRHGRERPCRLPGRPDLAGPGRRRRHDPARARGRGGPGRLARPAGRRPPAGPPAPRRGEPARLPRRDCRARRAAGGRPRSSSSTAPATRPTTRIRRRSSRRSGPSSPDR